MLHIPHHLGNPGEFKPPLSRGRPASSYRSSLRDCFHPGLLVIVYKLNELASLMLFIILLFRPHMKTSYLFTGAAPAAAGCAVGVGWLVGPGTAGTAGGCERTGIVCVVLNCIAFVK